MNRSLLVAGSVLIAGVAFSAAYARFYSASDVPRAAASSEAASRPAPSLLSLQREPDAAKSAEQERLEQRRVLYETVDALVHAADFRRARHLLDEDQARHGQDSAPEWRDLETSYRLMADCLEQPRSSKARLRAQAFVKVTEARVQVPKLLAACSSGR